jgi:hypothetical protein
MDPFAGHCELLTDFSERIFCIATDTEEHANYALIARAEQGDDPGGASMSMMRAGKSCRRLVHRAI